MVRLIWGVLCLTTTVALGIAGAVGWLAGWWVWAGVVLLTGLGLFGVYEARKGWCAVRAMGVKTPV